MTVTDRRQTRPLVRDCAPQRQHSNLQTENNIWSQVLEWMWHQDILTDWSSVVTWLWLWISSLCTNVTSKYEDLALQVGSLRWDSKIWPCVLRDFDLRVTALARPRSNCTVNYRPVLSSEKGLHNYKPATVWRKFQGESKIGRGSQMVAWHQDWLADWLSVVMWLRLQKQWLLWQGSETIVQQIIDPPSRQRGRHK
jgi:hypothetical protein